MAAFHFARRPSTVSSNSGRRRTPVLVPNVGERRNDSLPRRRRRRLAHALFLLFIFVAPSSPPRRQLAAADFSFSLRQQMRHCHYMICNCWGTLRSPISPSRVRQGSAGMRDISRLYAREPPSDRPISILLRGRGARCCKDIIDAARTTGPHWRRRHQARPCHRARHTTGK